MIDKTVKQLINKLKKIPPAKWVYYRWQRRVTTKIGDDTITISYQFFGKLPEYLLEVNDDVVLKQIDDIPLIDFSFYSLKRLWHSKRNTENESNVLIDFHPKEKS